MADNDFAEKIEEANDETVTLPEEASPEEASPEEAAPSEVTPDEEITAQPDESAPAEPAAHEKKKQSWVSRLRAKRKTPEISVYESTGADEGNESVIAETDYPAIAEDNPDTASAETADTGTTAADDPSPISDYKFTKRTDRKISLAAKLTIRRFVAISSVILLLIAALVVFAVILPGLRPESPYKEGSVVLKLPENNPNDGNYIFTSKDFMINGLPAKMHGVTVDERNLILYFDKYFEVSCMDFTLEDSEGGILYLDLSFHMVSKMMNKLYFRSPKAGTDSVRVNLPGHIKTAFDDFYIYFDKPLEFPDSVYTQNRGMEIRYENSSARLIINEASFSSAASVIKYSFVSPDGKFRVLPEADSVPVVRLAEKNNAVGSILGFDTRYNFGEPPAFLGSAGFVPLKSLKSPLKLEFQNLVYQLETDRTINAGKLFLDTPSSAIEFNYLDYKLVLERIGHRGDVYALILHTENLNSSSAAAKRDGSDRIYAKYEIELIGKDRNGNEIVLLPETYISEKGSDYIYTDEDSKIVNSPEGIQLRIVSAVIKANDIVYEFSPDDMSAELSGETQTALASVTGYFENENKDLPVYTAQTVSYSQNAGVFMAVIYEAGREHPSGDAFSAKYSVKGTLKPDNTVEITSVTKI